MPTEYGIRLTDVAGKKTIIKPEHTTVIAAGTTAMPSGLNGDGTYGVDITLPASNIPVADLGVIVIPHSPTKNVIYTRYLSGGNVVYTSHYADSASSYYTRNDSTGILTAWTAGNRTANDKDTWNPILACYPIAFWDKMGASTFTKVRLFAATAYLLRDTIDDTDFGLAGTASNSGGFALPSGTIDNIHDSSPLVVTGAFPNYTGTGWGNEYYGTAAYSGTTINQGFTVTITFSTTKIIDQVDCNWLVNSLANPGSTGNSFVVALYIGSTWYDVLTINISGSDVWQSGTNSTYGWWKGVTAIRVTENGNATSGEHNQWILTSGYVGELRAWGPNDTDADENKLVYSIGSSQIVDYLVTMRKWNY